MVNEPKLEEKKRERETNKRKVQHLLQGKQQRTKYKRLKFTADFHEVMSETCTGYA